MKHPMSPSSLGRLSLLLGIVTVSTWSSSAFALSNDQNTTTPIKHVIVVVGENHTFDSLFATYQPKPGQSIKNLLSQGIINRDGTPGPHFNLASQNTAQDRGGVYDIAPTVTGSYYWLPWPVFELGIPDLRFPFWLPNGPFQISSYVPYPKDVLSALFAITGDPVHRFFQMWQQTGGTNATHDKFVWVGQSTGQGGNTFGVTPLWPTQGGELMGFYNMATGDAPFFRSLADSYAISDNYHQGVMGGTGMNFFMIATGDLPVYTDANGNHISPPANQIENPNPMINTNNFYQQDGYSGGSWVKCDDKTQPGVAAIRTLLDSHNVAHNCDKGTYYLVNNYNPPFDVQGNPVALGAQSYVYPPQTVPTIAEALSEHDVSWKWYTGGREVIDFTGTILGAPLANAIGLLYYNNIGDPLNGSKTIVQSSLQRNLAGLASFYADLDAGTLPAVSYVVPANLGAGHPGQSSPFLYETFLQKLISDVQSHSDLWASTAIIVTTDEGGGFLDTGDIQLLDFFGDGPRIPMIVVSPYAKKGAVDHTYLDSASVLKFIEHNWGLAPLSPRSRDRLPNPQGRGATAYLPANAPAIGDLTSLFTFE